MIRTALYARFSTDLQSPTSADDQLRLCASRADRESWTVVDAFRDEAVSGATRDRPGLNRLLARATEFDVVLAESLDRISRDQEDTAAIHKRLRFAGAKLVTLSEGEIDLLQLGFASTIAAVQLRSIGEKTRRGQIGRVAQGRIPGGLSYGYARVAALRPDGEPERGLRTIVPAQADVIRRIFEAYARGDGPRKIAHALNVEGVASPSGGTWAANTIIGSRRRGTGILNNALYVGRIVYNRQRFVKDPDTRRRVSRVNDLADRVEHVDEGLRIVSDDLWQSVQVRLGLGAAERPDQKRRPKRLLSGKLVCGTCGGRMTIVGRETWGCSAARERGICVNRRTVSNRIVEEKLFAAVRQDWLHPDVLAAYVDEYLAAARAQRAQLLRSIGKHRKRIDAIGRELARLVDAIAAGVGALEVKDRMASLAAERDRLRAELLQVESATAVADHPAIAARFRALLADFPARMMAAAKDGEDATGVRDLIEKIVVTPSPEPRGCDLDLHGNLAAILRDLTPAGEGIPSPAPVCAETSVMLVAGAGFEPATFRL